MVDLGKGNIGFVIGAHNRNQRLKAEYNEASDLQAARQFFDNKKYTKGRGQNFSPQAVVVKAPKGKTDTEHIAELMQNTKNYSENEAQKNVVYPSNTENMTGNYPNSNSWEGSLQESVGGKPKGDFFGYDAAWDLRLPSSMFTSPPPAQNNQQGTGSSLSQSAAQQQSKNQTQQQKNQQTPPTIPPQPVPTP